MGRARWACQGVRGSIVRGLTQFVAILRPSARRKYFNLRKTEVSVHEAGLQFLSGVRSKFDLVRARPAQACFFLFFSGWSCRNCNLHASTGQVHTTSKAVCQFLCIGQRSGRTWTECRLRSRAWKWRCWAFASMPLGTPLNCASGIAGVR